MNRRDFLGRSLLASAAATVAAETPSCAACHAAPLRPSQPARRPAAGPLRVHPDNPRYFTDGSGTAIYLTGSHLGWELQDDAWDTVYTFDYAAYLSLLRAEHHDFIRLWVVEHTRSAQAADADAVASPMPYQRTGPGNALDGRPKFDLSRFDQAYFDRLRARVLAARDCGIYVAVMLFQGVSVWDREDYWFGHYLNAANNVNGINGDANGDGKGFEAHRLADPAIIRIQQGYVRKVVDTLNDLDNVLYEVANEDGRGSAEWQCHVINYVKTYQSGKPKQHPVGMTFRHPGGTISELYASPADWISPGGRIYETDPPAADGRKVVLCDSDHVNPKTRDPRFVWRNFLRGNNPIALDWDLQPLNASPSSRWQPIRQAMGQSLTLAARVNLAAMTPRGDLVSTEYCLADPGREYLVYVPHGGSVTVDLARAGGPLSVIWLDPGTGNATRAGETKGGARRKFTSPLADDALLYLSASELAHW